MTHEENKTKRVELDLSSDVRVEVLFRQTDLQEATEPLEIRSVRLVSGTLKELLDLLNATNLLLGPLRAHLTKANTAWEGSLVAADVILGRAARRREEQTKEEQDAAKLRERLADYAPTMRDALAAVLAAHHKERSGELVGTNHITQMRRVLQFYPVNFKPLKK